MTNTAVLVEEVMLGEADLRYIQEDINRLDEYRRILLNKKRNTWVFIAE